MNNEKESKCCEQCIVTDYGESPGQDRPAYALRFHCLNSNCSCHSKPLSKNWEKEFDEEFVCEGVTEDCQVCHPPTLKDHANVATIKAFISNLLSSYKQSLREKVERKKFRKGQKGYGTQLVNGYNQGLDSVLSVINEEK